MLVCPPRNVVLPPKEGAGCIGEYEMTQNAQCVWGAPGCKVGLHPRTVTG